MPIFKFKYKIIPVPAIIELANESITCILKVKLTKVSFKKKIPGHIL